MSYLAYLDDSRDPDWCVATAMVVSANDWPTVFARLKAFRTARRDSDGLLMRKEWHATDFVSGHGRIAAKPVTKGRRNQIFSETLQLLGGMAELQLINAVLPRKQEEWAYERVLNRLNKSMSEATVGHQRIMLIWDEGKNGIYRRLARKMRVHNPIPSKFGYWPETGGTHKNITLDYVIEDPVFKNSSDSYFLQMTDFCAFALLRRESPLASRSKYGLDTAFNALLPILNLKANEKDPEGIIR